MVAEPVPPNGQSASASGSEQDQAWWRRALDTLWRLVVTTVSSCLRYRVTGLAAEAAFFAVLSVPPLVFGLAGGIGYVTNQFDPGQVEQMRQAVIDASSRLLTDRAVDKVIEPTLNDVLRGGRFDIISLGFVLALWSGSRALNVFIDTITVMHGLGGHRGIIRTRALSFLLYVLALVTGVAAIPLMLAGPRLVADALPERARLPAELLLAGGRRDLHLLPGDALPRVGAGPDPLAVQPAGCGVLAGGLDPRQLPAAVDPHRDRQPTRARSTARWPRRSPCCSGSTWSPSPSSSAPRSTRRSTRSSSATEGR